MLSESARLALATQATKYETALRGNDTVINYLRSRGITGPTAQAYRLGYVTEGEYAGRVALPYLAADGSVVDIRFRAIDDTLKPKYLSRHGSGARLYSVGSILAATDTLYLTEGEIDAMTLNQIGIPAVGVPGATQWERHWSRLFLDFDHVIVVCDGDQAGTDFGRKVIEKVENATIIRLPDGEDVNSIYTTQGELALKGMMQA